MNIAKALKIKNRLVGELNNLQQIFNRENSRRSDNASTVNASEVYQKIDNTRSRLIAIRGAINKASAPISIKLVALAENKQYINFIKSIPCREGEEITLVGGNREKLSYEWKALFNRQKLDEIEESLQLQINNLQDEIDQFNASTIIEYVE